MLLPHDIQYWQANVHLLRLNENTHSPVQGTNFLPSTASDGVIHASFLFTEPLLHLDKFGQLHYHIRAMIDVRRGQSSAENTSQDENTRDIFSPQNGRIFNGLKENIGKKVILFDLIFVMSALNFCSNEELI